MIGKNKIYFIFAIYFIGSIFACLIIASQTEKIKDTDKYGISSDESIWINKNTSAIVEFEVQEDNFIGIAVHTKEKRYTSGRLEYSFFDLQTEEKLETVTVDLSKELATGLGHYMMVIPDKDITKGTELRVEIQVYGIGDGDYQLSVSEKNDNKSRLWVGTEEQKYSLVYNADYYAGVKSNVGEAVITFIILLLIGVWGLLYIKFEKKSNPQLLKKHSILKNTEKIIIKKRHMAGIAATVLIVAILGGYVYKDTIEDMSNKSRQLDIVNEILGENERVILNKDNPTVEQRITASMDDVRRFKISAAALEFSNRQWVDEDSALQMELYNETQGEMIYCRERSLRKRFDEGQVENFGVGVRKKTSVKQGDELVLRISLVNPGRTEISIYEVITTPEIQSALIDEEDVRYHRGIVQTIYYSDYTNLIMPYMILVFLLLGFSVVLYCICFIARPQIHKAFCVVGLLLGIFMGLVITIYAVPDESPHIDTVYAYSNTLLGISKPDISSEQYIYKRACDVDILSEQKTNVSRQSYAELVENIFTVADDTTLVKVYAKNAAANGGIVCYWPAVLGMTLARLAGVGRVPMILISRLFMLIVYVWLTSLAVKKMPFGKMIMVVMALLPIVLQEGASLCYDAMINGYAFLFLAVCLEGLYEKTFIRFRSAMQMLILGIIISFCKGGVYCLLVGLLFLIAYRRKDLPISIRCELAAILGIIVLFFTKSHFVSLIERLGQAQGKAVNGVVGTQLYTIGYFVERPLSFLKIFFHTIDVRGDIYLKQFLGGQLGCRNIEIQWFVLILFFVLLIASLNCEESQVRSIKKLDRIVMLLIFSGGFFAINLSMLLADTEIGSSFISGVQGRYFIPYGLVLLLVFAKFVEKRLRLSNDMILYGAGMANIIVILRVVQYSMYMFEY